MTIEQGDEPPAQNRSASRERPAASGRIRPLDYGEIRLMVLMLIAERPRHGYDLIRAIGERFSGTYQPSPGVIYPTLAWLAGAGLAEIRVSGTRKSYAASAAGLAHLDASSQEMTLMHNRIQAIRGASRRAPPPEITAAMNRIKAALRQRIGRGPLPHDEILFIAEQMNRAASAILQDK